MPRSSANKTTAPLPRLSLEGVSKSSNDSNGTPPTKEKIHLTSANFPMYTLFFMEFMNRHPDVEGFLGESLLQNPLQNFHQLLERLFFNWLNYRQNSKRTVYEIKREFMCIAEAVLLFELANQQRRLTPSGFVIGPFQVTLQQWAEDGDTTRFGVIPYSRPLCLPPISELDDSRLQIREEEMKLAGLEPFDDNEESESIDVSQFFSQDQ